eukprot:1152573-Pelagomonas_calceolata.AAC.3
MIEETPQIWVKALKKRGKQFPHKSARFDCCLLRKGSASNRMMPSGGSRNSQFSCIVRWDFCAATWVESSRFKPNLCLWSCFKETHGSLGRTLEKTPFSSRQQGQAWGTASNPPDPH